MSEFYIQGIDPQTCETEVLASTVRRISATIYDEFPAGDEALLEDFKDILVSAYHGGRIAFIDSPPINLKEARPMDDPWVIRKSGYYYRPNRSGYTGHLSEAGRYTEAEAKSEANVEPWRMTAIRLADVINSEEREDG